MKHFAETFITNVFVNIIVDSSFQKVVQILVLQGLAQGLRSWYELTNDLVQYVKLVGQ